MCVDMQMLLLNICLVTCYARLWIVNKITISLKLKVLKLREPILHHSPMGYLDFFVALI